ncbi:hypothetical protein NQ038_15000 [Brevibacterium sp. 50QC2O2]|uniref:hypothetical protein n=1 Tax=Brevibacterium TaxID=1696 RepID=UPI00211C378F|nr:MULTISPECIES: hypothetical protein [unclassified Brevibacterium]MCQ9386946.1 hypothetical protein [Brevibacterium sp. 68QC2CO]MCQ9389938.1 hypothetical protein [Brevibacterium sp. 50QC2O2]
MVTTSPARLAEPLLGGTAGAHAGPADRRFRAGAATWSLVLLGISCLLGLTRQVACFTDGWGFPGASHRLCASPVANAVLGQTFPDFPGRSTGGLSTFTPGNAWLVGLTGFGGSDVQTTMAFLLVINVAAFAVIGVSLLRLMPGSSWVAAAFLSPVVIFSLGQGLEPVAVAATLLALVLLTPAAERPSTGALVCAGLLFAVAVVISPIALLVPIVVCLRSLGAGRAASADSAARAGAARDLGPGARRIDSGDLLVMVGSGIIALGLLIIVDGQIIARAQAWLGAAVDRGSLVSLTLSAGLGSPRELGLLSLIVWAVALLAAAQLIYMFGRHLDLAQILSVVFGLSLLLLPAAPITLALWLVPAAAAAVHRLWVHVAWMLAEAALFIAVNLRDAARTQDKVGLDQSWLVIFTVLRLAAVLAVIVAALWPRDQIADRSSAATTGTRTPAPEFEARGVAAAQDVQGTMGRVEPTEGTGAAEDPEAGEDLKAGEAADDVEAAGPVEGMGDLVSSRLRSVDADAATGPASPDGPAGPDGPTDPDGDGGMTGDGSAEDVRNVIRPTSAHERLDGHHPRH